MCFFDKINDSLIVNTAKKTATKSPNRPIYAATARDESSRHKQ